MIDPAKIPIRNNSKRKICIESARIIREHRGSCHSVHCTDCPIGVYRQQELMDHFEVFVPENNILTNERYRLNFVKKFLKRYDPFFENSLKKNKNK